MRGYSDGLDGWMDNPPRRHTPAPRRGRPLSMHDDACGLLCVVLWIGIEFDSHVIGGEVAEIDGHFEVPVIPTLVIWRSPNRSAPQPCRTRACHASNSAASLPSFAIRRLNRALAGK